MLGHTLMCEIYGPGYLTGSVYPCTCGFTAQMQALLGLPRKAL